MRTAPGVGTRHDANKREWGRARGGEESDRQGSPCEGCNILTYVSCSCPGPPQRAARGDKTGDGVRRPCVRRHAYHTRARTCARSNSLCPSFVSPIGGRTWKTTRAGRWGSLQTSYHRFSGATQGNISRIASLAHDFPSAHL